MSSNRFQSIFTAAYNEILLRVDTKKKYLLYNLLPPKTLSYDN